MPPRQHAPPHDDDDVQERVPLAGNADRTADGVASAVPRRARSVTLVLALVMLVVAPLALLVTEVHVFDLKPTASRLWHSYLRGTGGTDTDNGEPAIDCSRPDDAVPLSRATCIDPLLRRGDHLPGATDATALYPDEIFQIDWTDVVTRADVLHMAALQHACTTYKESVIPWHVGHDSATAATDVGASLVNRTLTDQALIAALRQCPSLDIYIPAGLRGQGYCEDAAAYATYAHARLLPRWVFDMALVDVTQENRTVTYHELCPRTPLLVLNHYWDGLRAAPSWPSTKPLFLMPNIEMFELEAEHYWQADVVLCKTVVCADYVTQWFQQEGNPRLTRVLYTRHTTSDVATSALAVTAVATAAATAATNDHQDWHDGFVARKDFQAPTFVHTAGGSTQKGTARVLDCWLSRPDLPRLDIYMNPDLYKRLFRTAYDTRLTSEANTNIQLHLGSLNATAFGTLMANATVFLCTSRMEGYGHYINQARAAGGLVLTPDVPPMNELVTRESGVLVRADRDKWKRHFLGGASSHALGLRNVTGFVAWFSGSDVCAAVDTVLTQLNAHERQAKAHRARQQFLYDTAFFARKMDELRIALRPKEKHTLQL